MVSPPGRPTAPDVILLDLGLPDRDGDVVIRQVRRESTVPILVISARSQESDKVRALEIGADDYVTKPFGLAELRARVGGAAAPGRRRRRRPGRARARRSARPRPRTARRSPCDGAAARPHPARVRAAQDDDRAPRAGCSPRAGCCARSGASAYGDEGHYLHVYVSRLRRKLDAADPSGARERPDRGRAGRRLPDRQRGRGGRPGQA